MKDLSKRAAAPPIALLAFFLVCGATALWPASAFHPTRWAGQAGQAPVFQLSLPELNLAPTAQPEIGIPAPTLITKIVIHLLRPQADTIDYGQIFTRINGESAARVMGITTGERGKLVQLNLALLPGFRLNPGRNTVEIQATNRRNRVFYASFVLRTATESRNDVRYQVTLGNDARQQVPPELVLLEPEREITLAPGQRTKQTRIYGIATAANAVDRVLLDGKPLALKRGAQVTLRDLGLVNESKRAVFDTLYTPPAGAEYVTLEAFDTAGNRTQLQIPLRARGVIAQKFTGRKYALIVGISKFRHHEGGLNDLKYADADALALYQFLQTPAAGRFTKDQILLLTNEQATTARLREALTTFTAQPAPDDLLVIFIASHGSPDPYAPQNLYFLTHDTKVDDMAGTALAMKDVQSLLQQMARARRLVLLVDTCHSAGLTGSQGEQSRALGNNLVNLYAEKLYQDEGKAILTSSDVNETSQESPRWGGGHGVFTHFLLEGMKGGADTNGDHLVAVGELFQFVRARVRQDTQFRQNPRVLAGTNENLALSVASAGR